jgi:hypothetical protein
MTNTRGAIAFIAGQPHRILRMTWPAEDGDLAYRQHFCLSGACHVTTSKLNGTP